jgi:hypothetical protein
MPREIEAARFENLGKHAIAIVAAVTYFDGVLFDWAAYIGVGTPEDVYECYAEVAAHGNKLSRNDAVYYFPHLDAGRWRA